MTADERRRLLMAHSCECPKCGADISDSYEQYDPSVGIMASSWFCAECDEVIVDDGSDDYD